MHRAWVLFVCVCVCVCSPGVHAQPCKPHAFKDGIVCECTADYCDRVEAEGPLARGQGVVYETRDAAVDGGQSYARLSRQHQPLTDPWSFDATPEAARAKWNAGGERFFLHINRSHTMQTMLGFGGAFTDSVALNYLNMTAGVRQLLLQQYWGPDSIRYSVGRIPMAACDFGVRHYSYDDVDDDFDLTHFSVAMDDEFKIPLIRAALERAKLNLFGCPWTPPLWMKTNHAIIGGDINGTAGDRLHKTLAQYYVRFVQEYEKRGVPLWGLTVMNEPIFSSANYWETVNLPAEAERDFVREDLGPALRAANLSLQLMIGDEQRTTIANYAGTVLADPKAAQYVNGVGVHWYSDVEDAFPHWGELSKLHDNYPKPFILGTEACTGYLPFAKGPQPGSFWRGLRYAADILQTVNNWGVGWVDWNVWLNMQGGPTWAGNNIDAPILMDTDQHTVFYKNPMYYAMGHFSRFVPPQSVHVQVDSSTNIGLFEPALEATGFVTPEGRAVVVVVNRDTTFGREFQLHDADLGYAHFWIEKSAILTLVYQP